MTELQHRPLDTTLDLGVPGTPDGPPVTSNNHTVDTQPRLTDETVAIDLSTLGLPTHASKNAAPVENWTPPPEGQVTRYADVVLLGKSYRVERAVSETGRQAVKGYKAALAKFAGMPGHVVKKFAYDRAQASYDRVEERLRQAKWNNSGRQVMSQHNEALQRASDRLRSKSDTLHEHTRNTEARIGGVHGNAETKQRHYIADLRQKRVDALGRKAARQAIRTQGVSRSEAKDALAVISQEQIGRIGTAAINHETSRRKADAHTRQHRKIERTTARSERRMAKLEVRARTHRNDSWWHDDVAAVIGSELSTENRFNPDSETARQRVDRLEAETEIRKESPKDRSDRRVKKELKEAKREVAALSKNFDRHEKAAAASRRSAERASNQHTRLQPAHRARQTAAINAVTEAAARRRAEESDRTALSRELHQVLDADRAKERNE